MQEEIKQLRVSIDSIAQLTSGLKPIPVCNFSNNVIGKFSETKYVASKEITKAVDSLYMAKAWLGKVLQELGTESPYKSGYKTKDDIQPTADVANHNDKVSNIYHLNWKEMNHIEKVDWLRTEISKLTDNIFNLKMDLQESANVFGSKEPAIKTAIATTLSYQYLSEARFHLGFELQRIKESN